MFPGQRPNALLSTLCDLWHRYLHWPSQGYKLPPRGRPRPLVQRTLSVAVAVRDVQACRRGCQDLHHAVQSLHRPLSQFWLPSKNLDATIEKSRDEKKALALRDVPDLLLV